MNYWKNLLICSATIVIPFFCFAESTTSALHTSYRLNPDFPPENQWIRHSDGALAPATFLLSDGQHATYVIDMNDVSLQTTESCETLSKKAFLATGLDKFNSYSATFDVYWLHAVRCKDISPNERLFGLTMWIAAYNSKGDALIRAGYDQQHLDFQGHRFYYKQPNQTLARFTVDHYCSNHGVQTISSGHLQQIVDIGLQDIPYVLVRTQDNFNTTNFSERKKSMIEFFKWLNSSWTVDQITAQLDSYNKFAKAVSVAAYPVFILDHSYIDGVVGDEWTIECRKGQGCYSAEQPALGCPSSQ